MASGAYETLRATAAVANGAIAEADPTTTADFTPGRIVRSLRIKLAALVTSGAPTHVSGRIWLRHTGGVWDRWLDVVIPHATDAISGAPPIIDLPDVYADGVAWRFTSFTAGTSPAVVSFDFKVAEI